MADRLSDLRLWIEGLSDEDWADRLSDLRLWIEGLSDEDWVTLTTVACLASDGDLVLARKFLPSGASAHDLLMWAHSIGWVWDRTHRTSDADPLPTAPSPGVVYVITDGVRSKVGRSRNGPARLRTFQTGNPYPLRLHGEVDVEDSVAVEAEAHRLLSAAGIGRFMGGSEWFDCEADVALRYVREAAGWEPCPECASCMAGTPHEPAPFGR